MVERRGRKKGSKFVVPVTAIHQEASPCDPKSNNKMQKERSKAISMLVDMETEDGLKTCAVMVVAKKIALAHADLLYYRTNNIHFLLCTSLGDGVIHASCEFSEITDD